jgi:hypothetical protein
MAVLPGLVPCQNPLQIRSCKSFVSGDKTRTAESCPKSTDFGTCVCPSFGLRRINILRRRPIGGFWHTSWHQTLVDFRQAYKEIRQGQVRYPEKGETKEKTNPAEEFNSFQTAECGFVCTNTSRRRLEIGPETDLSGQIKRATLDDALREEYPNSSEHPGSCPTFTSIGLRQGTIGKNLNPRTKPRRRRPFL